MRILPSSQGALADDWLVFGEVARILWFAKKIGATRRPRTPLYELKSICMEYAGLSASSPNPDAGIRLMVTLGLARTKGDYITLTSEGCDLSSLSTDPVALNAVQRDAMFLHLTKNPIWKRQLEACVRLFKRDDDGRFVLSTASPGFSGSAVPCATLLYSLGAVVIDGTLLVLLPESLPVWDDVLTPRISMTEEEFAKILERRIEIGRAAEEFAVEWEKARLAAMGSQDLIPLVTRVSSMDVGRGYDIESVDGGDKGDTWRYIEVKGGASDVVSFHATRNEIETGRRLGKQHWLYFIPRSGELPGLKSSPLLFNNPFAPGQSIFKSQTEYFGFSMIPGLNLTTVNIPAEDSPSGLFLSEQLQEKTDVWRVGKRTSNRESQVMVRFKGAR